MIRGNYDAIQVDVAQFDAGAAPVTDVAERLARKGEKGEPARQMRLALAHIGVWSSAKFAFLLSVCLNTVTVVLIFLIVQVLTDTEVFSSVTGVYQDLTNRSVDLGKLLDANTVWAFAATVVALNTVLITALGAGYALLYNFSVRVTGGVLLGFSSS
ncbi:DUF3566 domain-containing protein [Cryobacterium sp. SO2]|uniref:DUF3566 domain-containing protein n=1 Tax=Cryobacterium sp. SO2 TaxID=1897060 RepID=UPI00223E408E|nr:DUF3566 domain-containing protein [Cryobacterium sp. SO2]WEO75869.1 DUF3566 domain-containing protein [Cryobacterium sp. SO2]